MAGSKDKNKLNQLTFVTAVLNEADNLAKLGKHLKPFLDNGASWVVVVDYRNKDESDKIAKSLGALVIYDKGESEGIVFANKNKGIKTAETKWVFIIDADEEMDGVLQKEIQQITSNQYPISANLYETGFINYEFGKFFKKCDLKDKTFVRLFKKGYFSYQYDKTAEGYDIQVMKEKPTVLKGKLIHYTHPTISAFLKKIDRYSTREARVRLKYKSDMSWRYIRRQVIYQPIREFVWKFFVWKLYKEGFHGFIVSTIFAFYHFLIWSKIYIAKYKK